MKQVIIVEPNGALKGLEHREKGIDLKRFGKAVVERITLIEWDSENCGWYIRWYLAGKANMWGLEELGDIPCLQKVRVHFPKDRTFPALFSSYEDAVSAEVEAIQLLQKQGSM